MRQSVETMHAAQTVHGKILGFPLQGFSLFQGMLLSVAAGLLAFWIATGLSIFALLFWNVAGRHSVNFADTYLYVGLPAGLIALAVSVPFFVSVWLRGKLRG
jgi:hypothetical protein